MKKPKKKPRLGTSRNMRDRFFKYVPYEDSETHAAAVPAGRCKKCGKITIAFCDKCNAWICEKHMVKSKEHENECYCMECDNIGEKGE